MTLKFKLTFVEEKPKKRFLIKCYCIICGNYIGDFYPSHIRQTCSEDCYKKLRSKLFSGINNPNYKHGKCIENRCKICNKIIDPRSTYCNTCRPERGGHQHSKKTKKLIGKKSKAKFTDEYLTKIREKYKGNKKTAINGYILIKDYEHPNRNSHNDVLEHVLVMTEYLGRPLEKGEMVHHIDRDRKNNNLYNLYLCESRSEHGKVHHSFSCLLKPLMELGIVIFKDGQYKLKEVVAQ